MAKKALMEKLKAKAKEMGKRKEERESGTYGSSFAYWKPRAGDQYFRILPHWEKDEDKLFFVEKVVHYIPTQRDDGTVINIPVACLREHFKKECPMCAAVQKLDAEIKTTKDEKLKKLKGQIRAQRKVLYNILDYGDKATGEEPKVAVWPCPETVNEDIIVWVEDLGDFSDIESGFDWMLRKTLDKKRGPIGTRYKVIPSRKETAIPAKLRPLLDDMANLDKIWADDETKMMYDALKMLKIDLEDEIPFEPSSEKEEERTSKKTAAKTSKKTAPVKSKPKKEEDDDDGPSFDDFGDVDDDEEADIEAEDDDLEEELAAMGVK